MSALSSKLPTPLPSRPSSPTAIDPRAITEPAQIAAQLALLTRRESELSLALNALVADRGQIEGALARLHALGSQVDRLAIQVDGGAGPSQTSGLHNGSMYIEDDGGGLIERVRRVWETSERVGGKVRRLDDEVGRVKEAADIVTEVLELKASLPVVSFHVGHADQPACRMRSRHSLQLSRKQTGNPRLALVEELCPYVKRS